MIHVRQSRHKPNMFWAVTHEGVLLLEEIWLMLPKSPMDDFQLVIHPDDADKAKRMLAHRGIEFINF